MQNYNSNPSAYAQKQIYETQRTSSRRRTQRQLVLASCAWMLLGLALLLTGCGHQSQLLCPEPTTTLQPALTQPIPLESYSISVGQRIKSWGLSLTGTPPMSKP